MRVAANEGLHQDSLGGVVPVSGSSFLIEITPNLVNRIVHKRTTQGQLSCQPCVFFELARRLVKYSFCFGGRTWRSRRILFARLFVRPVSCGTVPFGGKGFPLFGGKGLWVLSFWGKDGGCSRNLWGKGFPTNKKMPTCFPRMELRASCWSVPGTGQRSLRGTAWLVELGGGGLKLALGDGIEKRNITRTSGTTRQVRQTSWFLNKVRHHIQVVQAPKP